MTSFPLGACPHFAFQLPLVDNHLWSSIMLNLGLKQTADYVSYLSVLLAAHAANNGTCGLRTGSGRADWPNQYAKDFNFSVTGSSIGSVSPAKATISGQLPTAPLPFESRHLSSFLLRDRLSKPPKARDNVVSDDPPLRLIAQMVFYSLQVDWMARICFPLTAHSARMQISPSPGFGADGVFGYQECGGCQTAK